MEKSLLEQIEQADASEFVRFAIILSTKVKTSNASAAVTDAWEKQFLSHLKYKSGHIAAAIMLMDVTGGGSQMALSANPLV